MLSCVHLFVLAGLLTPPAEESAESPDDLYATAKRTVFDTNASPSEIAQACESLKKALLLKNSYATMELLATCLGRAAKLEERYLVYSRLTMRSDVPSVNMEADFVGLTASGHALVERAKPDHDSSDCQPFRVADAEFDDLGWRCSDDNAYCRKAQDQNVLFWAECESRMAHFVTTRELLLKVRSDSPHAAVARERLAATPAPHTFVVTDTPSQVELQSLVYLNRADERALPDGRKSVQLRLGEPFPVDSGVYEVHTFATLPCDWHGSASAPMRSWEVTIPAVGSKENVLTLPGMVLTRTQADGAAKVLTEHCNALGNDHYALGTPLEACSSWRLVSDSYDAAIQAQSDETLSSVMRGFQTHARNKHTECADKLATGYILFANARSSELCEMSPTRRKRIGRKHEYLEGSTNAGLSPECAYHWIEARCSKARGSLDRARVEYAVAASAAGENHYLEELIVAEGEAIPDPAAGSSRGCSAASKPAWPSDAASLLPILTILIARTRRREGIRAGPDARRRRS